MSFACRGVSADQVEDQIGKFVEKYNEFSYIVVFFLHKIFITCCAYAKYGASVVSFVCGKRSVLSCCTVRKEIVTRVFAIYKY